MPAVNEVGAEEGYDHGRVCAPGRFDEGLTPDEVRSVPGGERTHVKRDELAGHVEKSHL
jgi:hypothetical protein